MHLFSKKSLLIFTLLSTTIILLTSCKSLPDNKNSSAKKEDNIQKAYIYDSFDWANCEYTQEDFLSPTEEFNKTAQQIVLDMEIGINLGNTFESYGDWIKQFGGNSPSAYETAWGSPIITKDMIKGYKDAGFNTLRIPVAWTNLMRANNKISNSYLNRVKQIIDWALEYDLYVIVNEHWDGGWIEEAANDSKFEVTLEKYRAIWSQLSETFKNYGVHLIFESQNEELGSFGLYGDWDSNKGSAAWESKYKKSYELCAKINQTFVNVVRSSGGNNMFRLLYISGYNTNIDKTCDPLFKMPEDPANRQAISVHYYTPALYAILEEDAGWGKCATTWGSDAELKELEQQVALMKETYTDKGIPVIIGEYGCPRSYKASDGNKYHKKNTDLYLYTVCEKFYKAGMCPVLWDIQTNGANKEGTPSYDPYMLYDRKTQTVNEPELMNKFKELVAEGR